DGRLHELPMEEPGSGSTRLRSMPLPPFWEGESERLKSDPKNTGSCESSYSLGSQASFRVNIYRQNGHHGIVMRKLQSSVPTLESLGLPPIFQQMVREKFEIIFLTDSEPNFRLVDSILQDRPGTELIWAETGQKGLGMARANPPELVLLDLDLPDLHGSKVLEGLQAQPETAHTPVIVISADATPNQIGRMLAAGARNHLTKPFEIRRLLYMFDEVFLPA
ncbi:MAG: response regulator, partial [Chthoniobacterales bacterium]